MSRLFLNVRDFVNGRSLRELIRKGARLVRREGMVGLLKLYRNLMSMNVGYGEWIRRYDTLSATDRELIREHIGRFSYRPLISVLMPVYNTPGEYLQQAIASVRNQLYPDWELCIADDASTLPCVRVILDKVVREDSRIRITYRGRNGHISAASNTALEMARGEFIALLDHDDELSEHALYHVAVALNENTKLDLLYSDEDKIDVKGRRFGHYFKSGWNPDLFHAQNLISHLGVYRRARALAIGGFREGYEGSQDWDFALRFAESLHSESIRHLPYVLYHWRAIAGSTASTIDAKQYAVTAGQRALQEAWWRRGVQADVIHVDAGHFSIRLPLSDPRPKVTVVICTLDRVDLLRQCINGITERTDYPDLEILIVDNGSLEPVVLDYLNSLRASRPVSVLLMPEAFNFSVLYNAAARHSAGDIVCLLSNHVLPIRTDWLQAMVAHALRPDIGAVGAKLLYPSGTIKHGGVLLDGVAAGHFGHLHRGYPGTASGYGNRAKLPHNVSAVTAACLVIRRAIWNEVGGMDENFAVAFNDVDFCLRIQEHGYRNLWLPQAELYHFESASRGQEGLPGRLERFEREVALLQERWGALLHNDPYWNPNLALNGERIGLATPPRIARPWLTTDA